MKGKLFYPNGDFYEGDFKDDLKHGLGNFQFEDGRFYNGQFIDDKANGKGFYRQSLIYKQKYLVSIKLINFSIRNII